MARPRKITLFKSAKTYYAKFYNAEGARCNKSLKTNNEPEAKTLIKELELLTINPAVNVSPMAKNLFFGEIGSEPVEKIIASKDVYTLVAQYQAEIINLRQKVRELEPFEQKYNALLNTIEARSIAAQESTPFISEVLEKYLEEVQSLTNGKNECYNFVEKFFIEVTGLYIKLSEVKAKDIDDFIILDAKKGVDFKMRYNKKRKKFTRFFNWACGFWAFENPMNVITQKKIKNNKDIQWCEREEIEKIIEGIQEPYWRALVATLVYTGLSAHELRGLRVVDLDLTLKTLYVTPHNQRTLKTNKRKRSMMISEALFPYLQKLDLSGPALFTPTIGNLEYWQKDTMSKQILKILPPGITCLTLRRTFGSLLLRSGKSVSEVAAAMGNSATMVEKHYARILGHEVDTNF